MVTRSTDVVGAVLVAIASFVNNNKQNRHPLAHCYLCARGCFSQGTNPGGPELMPPPPPLPIGGLIPPIGGRGPIGGRIMGGLIIGGRIIGGRAPIMGGGIIIEGWGANHIPAFPLHR